MSALWALTRTLLRIGLLLIAIVVFSLLLILGGEVGDE